MRTSGYPWVPMRTIAYICVPKGTNDYRWLPLTTNAETPNTLSRSPCKQTVVFLLMIMWASRTMQDSRKRRIPQSHASHCPLHVSGRERAHDSTLEGHGQSCARNGTQTAKRRLIDPHPVARPHLPMTSHPKTLQTHPHAHTTASQPSSGEDSCKFSGTPQRGRPKNSRHRQSEKKGLADTPA